MLESLRSRPDAVEVTDPMIASLVAHLGVRTKHLRDSIWESTDLLLDELARHLSDARNLSTFLLSDPTVMEGAFQKQMSQLNLPESERNTLVSLMTRMVPGSMDGHAAEFAELVRLLLFELRASVLPSAARNAPIKALAATPVPEPLAEHYRSLRWFVCHSPVPLILGDVGCRFEVPGPKRYKSLDEKDDRVEGVSLPLASDRVLVGTVLSAVPRVGFSGLAEAHAKCSREFFVCSAPSDRMRSLAARIGVDAGFVTREEMTRLLPALLSAEEE